MWAEWSPSPRNLYWQLTAKKRTFIKTWPIEENELVPSRVREALKSVWGSGACVRSTKAWTTSRLVIRCLVQLIPQCGLASNQEKEFNHGLRVASYRETLFLGYYTYMEAKHRTLMALLLATFVWTLNTLVHMLHLFHPNDADEWNGKCMLLRIRPWLQILVNI